MENKPQYIEYEDGTRVLLNEDDAPEATEEFFKNAKPFNEVFPEVYTSWKKTLGRPKIANPKKITSFKLSQEVIDAIKATGKGYNSRVDAALRAAFIGG